uniref:Uncharacterized protein n=1 Tax=Arundo donax TaxID=35708 RepID=A0A0A9B7J6_ARUDO
MIIGTMVQIVSIRLLICKEHCFQFINTVHITCTVACTFPFV